MIAMHSSAIEIRSPAVSSMSISRPCGSCGDVVGQPHAGRRWSCPSRRRPRRPGCRPAGSRTMWSATARIRSGSATEVPPNFCTIKATAVEGTGDRVRPANAAPVPRRPAEWPSDFCHNAPFTAGEAPTCASFVGSRSRSSSALTDPALAGLVAGAIERPAVGMPSGGCRRPPASSSGAACTSSRCSTRRRARPVTPPEALRASRPRPSTSLGELQLPQPQRSAPGYSVEIDHGAAEDARPGPSPCSTRTRHHRSRSIRASDST